MGLPQLLGRWTRLVPRRAAGNVACAATSKAASPNALSRWRSFVRNEGNGARRIVGHWLVATSGLVAGIVVLGGLTRLTESGLSMVDWKLIHFSPPRSASDWQAYFEKYQEYPEYKINNKGMTLEEFKRIYYFEHAHRVYGRLLGLFVALPAVFFVSRRWVTPGMRNLLAGCTGLVVFQGLLGWYMVKSGLSHDIVERGEVPRVSAYRLSAHLTSALLLFVVTLSGGLGILSGPPMAAMAGTAHARQLVSLSKWSHLFAGVTFATAVTGGFVAGLDAGLLYNTFPLMGDRAVPSDLWDSRLGLRNLTENPTTVQFLHRCMAITTVSGITGMWLLFRSRTIPPQVRRALGLVAAAAWCQGSLGVLTLLWFVPIPVASAHQAGSLGLLASFVWLLNRLARLVPR